jgi:large subunit ribosomal protein L24
MAEAVLKKYRFRIKKGDLVQVISGREKGKTGKVLTVVPDRQQVFVEKLNFIKRHTRPNQRNRQGGIIEKEGPLHISKVMLICSNCERPVRVGIRQFEDGNKDRVCRDCGEVIEKK